MTVLAPTTAKAVLDVARSQLGVSEQPPGSNLQPYGAWYGMNGVAWCDEFFSWTDWKAGWADAPHFAATTAHAAWFQKHGAWLTRDQTPPEGSAIFYDWGHGIEHIGRWEGLIADGRISSIEGNTDSAGGGSGGRVMRQYRSRALIAGFGVITYQPTQPEEDDMARPSFLAKSDDPKDTAIYLMDGNFGSAVHLSSMDNVTWVKQIDQLSPAGSKLLVDQTIHTVKASVLADIAAPHA